MSSRHWYWFICLILTAAAAGCRRDMFQQPSSKPLATSDFFRADYMASRPLVAAHGCAGPSASRPGVLSRQNWHQPGDHFSYHNNARNARTRSGNVLRFIARPATGARAQGTE
jgi:hypothetical protein